MIQSKQLQRRQLVLIVDDYEINRDALGIILEDDYDIIYAENGKEALEKMREHLTDLSIVMLDLIMPVMSGFEVLEVMKDDEELSRIPVIVLTAEKDAELTALQMGAADFITKPFDQTEVILARVSRIIELSEGRQLISSAEHDRLTGLYTRNFFIEYADRLYKYHTEMKFDAVVMNIEQFHTVNALNGREFGDVVMKRIGDAVKDFLKETDGIACRFEADSFEIFCIAQPDYRALLDRIQESVNSITDRVSVHLRMGVKPWQEGVNPLLQFDQARAACNKVRGNYQDPLKIYGTEMLEKELMDQRLFNDLKKAVTDYQFKVYFQPKYDIQCDPPRLASAEALIRWVHPDLGFIRPDKFVPLFEGNGVIGVVDHFVWGETAKQIRAWKDKYDITLPVSVNLSRADVFDPNLKDRLRKLIEENGLTNDDIDIELTESAYTENVAGVLEIVGGLQEMGFDIEMDDFGSGYSSLNMLSDMPFDVLKMDMKFVRNIEHSETDRKLVKLILDIAKDLQVKVIAEGVETEKQMKFIKDNGCDYIQGYYFSKPLPPEEFGKLIEKELSIKR